MTLDQSDHLDWLALLRVRSGRASKRDDRYFALCGVEVLVASLTEAPQRQCRLCVPIPSQKLWSNR